MTTTVGLKVGSVTACAVVESSGGRSVTCRSSALALSADSSVDVTDAADGLRIDFPELVPNPTPFGLPAGGTATVAELYAGAVGALLDRSLRAGSATRAQPAQTVLAVPAHWDATVIDRVTARCTERGIENLHTVAEPVAAASWLRHFHGADEPVLVFDMGGHSLDLAVVGFEGRPHVIGTAERSQTCTGDVLDDVVLQHVIAELGADSGLLESTDPQDVERVVHLRGACRSAREALSTDDEAVISDAAAASAAAVAQAADTDADDTAPDTTVRSVTLTRGALDSLIDSRVHAATAEAADVIRASGATVGTVLLTGGCTDTPLITDIVSTELALPVVCHPYPATTSAAGAALPSADARRAAVPAPRPAPTGTTEAPPERADSGSFDPDREAITETLQAVVVEPAPRFAAYAEVDEAAITEPTEPADPSDSAKPARRERGRTLPLFGAAAAAAAIVMAVVGAVIVLNPAGESDRAEADQPTVTEEVVVPPATVEAPPVDVPVVETPQTAEPVPAPVPVPAAPAPAPPEPAPASETAPPPAPSPAPVPPPATAPTTTAAYPVDRSPRVVDDVLDSTNGIVNDVLDAVPGF